MHRIARILSIAALAALVAGCQTNKAASAYIPGTYTGSSYGFGGVVEVTVTVDSAKILDIAIKGDKETAALGGAAMAQIQAQVKKTGKVDIDAVSGASHTSAAIKEALGKALAAAKGVKAAVLKDGKYTTKIMGHEGFIHVATMFRDGKIDSVTVLSHEETMGIGSYAAARIPGRIVKAQSLGVSVVSGATVSSNAIKSAVAEAITKAGGDIKAFQKEVVEPVVKEKVQKKVDVVIAGAGTAGLVAGARLAEQGKTVIIFEKQDIPGGSMPMTYGGVVSSGTKVGAAYGLGREKKDPTWNENLLLTIMKGYIDPKRDRFNKGAPYRTAMLDASGPMLDWMRDIGIGFAPMGRYEGSLQLGYTPYFSPGCYQGGAGYAAMTLADRIVALGGTIVYATPVTSLVTEGGKVQGLKAEGKDGKSWEVTADAVLLATGGFAGNKDMIAQYYPAYKDFQFNTLAANTGEGMRMGVAAGGTLEFMDRPLPAFPAVYGSNYEIAFINMTVPGILVNVDGTNTPDASHRGLGEALLNPVNKQTFYYVFDDAGAEMLKKSMNYGLSYASVFDRHEAVHYSSVAEAAKALGLPKLQESVDATNKLSLSGKPKVPYIETRDGVWLLRVSPNYYLTTGGLAIDTKAHVLDKDGKPVAGLYAAGDVAGSIEEKDGNDYGYGFSSATTYGYIAAATVAAETKK